MATSNGRNDSSSSSSNFTRRSRAERQLHEAIADYFAERSISEEAREFTSLIATLGPPLPANSDVHWRRELARIHDELNEPNGPNYAFLLDHVIEVLCRELFESKLFFHILVERLAILFHGHDAELFKLESDVLCHGGGVIGICRLLLDRHFKGDEASTAISKFLQDFAAMFDDDDPKARWDEIVAIHQLPRVTFERDLKRALKRLSTDVLGPSRLVQLFLQQDVAADAVEPPTKRVRRADLEPQFPASATAWLSLAPVHSVGLHDDTASENHGGDDEENVDEVEDDETAQAPLVTSREQHSDAASDERHAARRASVWSTQLPFATTRPTMTNDNDHAVVASQIDDDDNGQDGDGGDSDNDEHDDNSITSDDHHHDADHNDDHSDSISTESDSDLDSAAARRASTPARAPPPAAATSTTTNPQTQTQQPAPVVVVRQKRKRWSEDEVDALLRGYREFEALPNVWVMIKSKYADALTNRSNVDLKDKYRNLLKYNQLPPSTDDQQEQQ